MKSISVFCASASGEKPIYMEQAYLLGSFLAKNGYELIYGGAAIGLMGSVARGALDNNGKVIGVLPHFLNKREISQDGLHELIMVESMHERKLKMNELSDGSITLPGGFGTLEEFFEIITWGQLGLHSKPTALFNIDGYYDHLIAHLKHMNAEKLLKDKHFEMLIIEDDLTALIEKMENYQPPEVEKWLTDKTS